MRLVPKAIAMVEKKLTTGAQSLYGSFNSVEHDGNQLAFVVYYTISHQHFVNSMALLGCCRSGSGGAAPHQGHHESVAS